MCIIIVKVEELLCPLPNRDLSLEVVFVRIEPHHHHHRRRPPHPIKHLCMKTTGVKLHVPTVVFMQS